MSLPKYKELIAFTSITDIDKEIFELQKNLFDLRLKRLTKQSVKPHIFSHLKRRIAQLMLKRSVQLKGN
jgi:large subunit ribosomal protein L29